MGDAKNRTVADEWVSFPGGELEGERPEERCSGCRAQALRGAAGPVSAGRLRTLCFQCYRAGLDRKRALLAAADLDTSTAERFQTALPFEPVNVPRLAMLKVERATARNATRQGMGQFVERRRQAQIAARRALQVIFAGVEVRQLASPAQMVPPPQADRRGPEGSERLGRPRPPGCNDRAAGRTETQPVIMTAIRAAELQLPESWLPFVVSR